MSVLATLALAVLTQSADWKPVWSDEFDRPGAPDPTKWDYEVGYIRNKELQFYTKDRRENARVENGKLVIEARRDNFEDHPVTSASLITLNRATWTYGKIEVRAKIPTGLGVWPAIWMLGEDRAKVGWPRCGEIDIMESVGFDPNKIHWTVHTNKPGTKDHIGRGSRKEYERPYDDFHVYGLEWSKERMDFFFDGEKTYSFVRSENPDMEWNFDKPHYLILNLAMGGSWGGQKGVDEAIYPSKFEIDYVRVFQRK